MKYKIIIPARYASQRLPGKPLLDIAGKPMIQHVYDRATQSNAQAVYVAVDDERIMSTVKTFTDNVCMTSPDHPSGTDRLCEVAQQLNWHDDDIIVNVQGDEPLMPVAVIEQLAKNMHDNPDMLMATLCEPIDNKAHYDDPNIVKVVADKNNRALYFSRSSIPFMRDATGEQIPKAYRHLGLYAYRVAFLKQYLQWPQADIEAYEKLEQLRALYEGVAIHVEPACESIPPGVDTREDLENIRALFTH